MQTMVASGAVNDPYFYLNTLLLNTTSTNLAQNNTFQDSSGNSFAVVRAPTTGPNAPTQGTFSPYSQTGWSNYFGGTSDGLSIAGATANYLGSGDYTVETWIYVNNINTLQTVLSYGATGATFRVFVNNATIWVLAGGTNITGAAGASVVTPNQWMHLAITRSGSAVGNTKVYINGINVITSGISSTTNFNTGTLYIGLENGTNPFSGYMSNYRIIKGQALTSGNFTPPTGPVNAVSVGWTGANVAGSITGTVPLVTCQSNRFVDNSSNGYLFTVAGTPSVQVFSPFAPTAAYSTSTIGGSGYFDRTGDYLDINSSIGDNPNLTIGTANFTIAMWVYFRVIDGTSQFIFDGRPSSVTDNVTPQIIYSAPASAFVYQTNGSIVITGTASVTTANQWYYVVVSRVSGTTRLFVNGVQQGSNYTDTNNYVAFALDRPRIGARSNSAGASLFFGGYISGLQFLVGAGTSAPVTPTAPPTIATSNTQLLLNFTNANIYDATAKNVLETVGTARVSTFTPAKFGTSIFFNGTTDYLDVKPYPGSLAPVFNNGPWTIEFWFYTSSTARQCFIDTRSTTSSNTGLTFYVNPTTPTLGLQINSIVCTSTATLPQNTWNYIAVTSTGGTPATATIYLNGVSVASGSTSQTITDQYLRIGATAGASIGSFANGYMDELRITKGLARNVTTVPTAPFPIQ